MGVEQTSAATAESSSRTLVGKYTPYEANTFMLELEASGLKILTDPWLQGKLVFADQTWFFEGEKPYLQRKSIDVREFTEGVDFILLSQSLDDHCHQPTLKALPKDIPVVATPVAADVARQLGFKTVHSLDHGQTIEFGGGQLKLSALEGAKVGPPWSKRQNALLFKETNGVSLYYEPHANHNLDDVRRVAPVDVCIVPTTSSYAAGYPLVSGQEGVPELLRALRPRVVVPLINDSVIYKGALSKVLTTVGSTAPEPVKAWLAEKGVGDVEVAGPQSPGEPLEIRV